MRKSTLFISGTLTAFMLAILYAVLSSYSGVSEQSSAVTEVAAVAEATASPVASTTALAYITPEQAAAIAAQVLGRTDLYSVESALMTDGSTAYKVTFTSGDVVYVALDGAILSVVMVTPAPVVVVDSSSSSGSNNNKNGGPRPPGIGGDDGGGGDD